MRGRPREHTSDEFGRTGLGSAAAIGDRALGAAPGVIVDGLVEADSGMTPGPGISSRKLALAFGALALVAIAIAVGLAIMSIPDPLPVGVHEGVWLGVSSAASRGADIEFRLMPDAGEGESTPEWAADPAAETVFVIDGQVVTADTLAGYLQGGMVRADVTASSEGSVSRIEITTPEVTGD